VFSSLLQWHEATYYSSTLERGRTQTTRAGRYKLIKRYELSRSVGRRPGSGQTSKVGEEVRCAIDEVIEEDDKTKSIRFIKN
jgi:hypothetical protein